MIPQTKDSVMETIAGFFNGKMASLNLKTSTHTVGLNMIKTVADIEPIRIEATAPAVVNFFQTIDKKRAGKFPLAAIAKARPTIKATFWPLKRMPSKIATIPKITTEILAILTCSASLAWPFLKIETKISWDRAEAAARVRPATTARIVAKATAAINPIKGVPPRSSASNRAAILPPLSTFVIISFPTITAAMNPTTGMMQ